MQFITKCMHLFIKPGIIRHYHSCFQLHIEPKCYVDSKSTYMTRIKTIPTALRETVHVSFLHHLEMNKQILLSDNVQNAQCVSTISADISNI